MKNKNKEKDFWSLLGSFFQTYPSQRNLSENTVVNWRYTWNLFLDWMINTKGLAPQKITMDTMTAALLTEFLDCMASERNWMPQTRNERLPMIRSFFQYAASNDGSSIPSRSGDTPRMPGSVLYVPCL